MASLKTAILRTLIYADLFGFPLTVREIHQFLISSRPVSLTRIKKALAQALAAKKVAQANGLYFLPGQKKIVGQRRKREQWSREKLTIARRAANWLKLIPSIKMVAVTGALAINNAKKDDDIDLLIIASRGCLWLTRLLTVLLIELVARRRRPQDSRAKDKLCLNMFLEENHLKVPRQNQDLFTAHEVVQLRLLWDKGETYQKFIKENQWVKRYLSNAIKLKRQSKTTKKQKIFWLDWLERLAYRFQLAYMRPRQTIEIVQPHRIHFRLHDHREWVLAEYQKRCARHRIGR